MKNGVREFLFGIVVTFSLTLATLGQETVTIAEVQGDKAMSPMENKQVTVRGILTAKKNNGIFIQTPDDKIDSNPLTSEGLFVYLSKENPFDGEIGDLVEATGQVQEYRPRTENYGFTITELGGRTSVKKLSSKNPLPAPITLTSSDLVSNKLDTLERYEGMRVKVDTLIVVGPTGGYTASERNKYTTSSDGAFFGVLPGVARPMREAGVEFFYHRAQKLADSVPYFDTNPEMIRVDSDAQVGAKAIDVTAGATVKNLTGVMDYSFRRYTLVVDAFNPPTVEGNRTYIAVSPAADRQMTVASFNIENFFDDEKNSDASGETVYPKEYFKTRLNKASLAIRKVLAMPDVIGVEEVENLKTLKKLAAKINADVVADGKPDPKYDAFLEEGNDGRGIDSGFLVKTTKIKVLETKQLAKGESLKFSDTAGDASLFDRPPFLIRVQAIDDKQSEPFAVTVIVNHLKSYLGIDGDKSARDGERVREKRKQEAEWLANFVAERAKELPDENLIVCGDMNAYLFPDGYNDLIGTLKGKPDQKVTNPSKTFATGLYDLADFMADPKNKYSYVHDGSMQVLDHILINKHLLKWSEGRLKFGYARLNADFPVAWSGDDTRPERLSDHDAPVVFLALDPPPLKVPPTTTGNEVPQAGVTTRSVQTPSITAPADEPPPIPAATPKPPPAVMPTPKPTP